jgi:hypothetical protein
MQEVADVGGVAAGRIAVIVGDQVAQPGGVPRLGRGFGLVDQRADLLFRRARVTAGGERKQRSAGEPTQAVIPTAGGRR